MVDESRIWAAEADYFSALLTGKTELLDRLLHHDFTMVDVSGALITRPELISAIAWGNLSFDSVDPVEATVRFYGTMAVVTGQSKISGQFGGTAFLADSRYTHVYLLQDGHPVMVAAQGTAMNQ